MPLKRGRIHLVGGVSSMGKTSFCVSVVLGAANAGYRVVFASPATSPFETRLRLAGANAGVDSGFGFIGWLPLEEDQRLDEAREALGSLSIRLLEEPLLSFGELHNALRPAGGCDLLVVDDVQAMSPAEEYDRGACLSWLARWLRIPILVTLGMPIPDRPDPLPVLGDFPVDLVRVSDVVMALYRPAYYSAIEDSARKWEKEEHQRATSGMVLWDREGVWRGFPLSLQHEAGPVFV